MSSEFPTSKTLLDNLIESLIDTGRPLSSSEMDELIIKKLNLSHEVVSKIREGNRTEIKYRLAWCRTKAKQSGLIERTANNKWQLRSQIN